MKRKTLAMAVVLVAVLVALFWLQQPDRGWSARGKQGVVASAPDQIARGKYLVTAGDCIACHTSIGGMPYAGDREIPTPFGSFYSSNLTPDHDTGLGPWSADDFWGALHFGRSRDGRRLYPAFPYTNYTLISREDADAMFAYLRTLAPVRQSTSAPSLRFPYDTQLALRIWRALYFRPGEFREDASKTKSWNRGAYLVDGLGHCDACHSRRNWLGGVSPSKRYSGGPIPMLGWDALPLTSEAPISEADAPELTRLMKAGTSERDVMSGPMAEVVFRSLQYLDDADLAAMVEYLRSLPQGAPAASTDAFPISERERKQLLSLGESVYRKHCVDCHGEDGRGKPFAYPALAGNRLATAPSPSNAIETTLFGGYGASTAAVPQPYGMPPYANVLTPSEIGAVLTYVRASWGNQASAVSPLAVEHH